jgi:hypothetical protein
MIGMGSIWTSNGITSKASEGIGVDDGGGWGNKARFGYVTELSSLGLGVATALPLPATSFRFDSTAFIPYCLLDGMYKLSHRACPPQPEYQVILKHSTGSKA